ncbi:O-antigen ligase family protein [Gracilibacillus caseinilyticus]|uniref:O-antigen ligase family protein n=1 Tax=Gracilibacillus caseinilyticus TaxID=2932256 RepID=A0ABY4F0T7_9BACI|nr:O-antigen ligase family protein [Gracilibacillus caseinilyticus]UOQ50288.1 O-antigen ligase family protein [Gracilibacillus caseinilyticus]
MSKVLNNDKFFQLLTLFIILQPILDILTNAMLQFTNSSITIGILIRMLFMGIALFFIFFGSQHPYKKQVSIYLALLLLVLGIGFINNYFQKPVFNLFIEVQWLTKVIYFSVMICSIYLLFQNKKNVDFIKTRLLNYIIYALVIIGVSILIAIITNTSVDSYEWVKAGFKGWFYSANELSALLAIGFPLSILFAIRKTKSWYSFWVWIPALLVALIGALIGTKVGLFAVYITCIFISLFIAIHYIVASIKKTNDRKILLPTFVYSIALLAVILIVSPFTPGYQNLSVELPEPDQEDIDKGFEDVPGQGGNGESSGESEDEIIEGEDTRVTFEINSPIVNKILSSRHIYFTWQLNQMIRADVSQKILGMGYAGNYINNRKTIEMDFFDIFFSFGVIGFILVMLPLFMLIGIVLKKLFTNFKQIFHVENISLIISILLGLGIALIAGHVWVAPAVNLYLALSMVLLYINLKTNE